MQRVRKAPCRRDCIFCRAFPRTLNPLLQKSTFWSRTYFDCLPFHCGGFMLHLPRLLDFPLKIVLCKKVKCDGRGEEPIRSTQNWMAKSTCTPKIKESKGVLLFPSLPYSAGRRASIRTRSVQRFTFKAQIEA